MADWKINTGIVKVQGGIEGMKMGDGQISSLLESRCPTVRSEVEVGCKDAEGRLVREHPNSEADYFTVVASKEGKSCWAHNCVIQITYIVFPRVPSQLKLQMLRL